tara:strand:+ start:79 stop:1281 length:1203 start_codon:yes stop_codon:yes gene_type:complete
MAERQRLGGRKLHRERGVSKDPRYNSPNRARRSEEFPTRRSSDFYARRGITRGTAREDAAQEMIANMSRGDIGPGSRLPTKAHDWEPKEISELLKKSGVRVLTNENGLDIAIHPLSMRRVPASALFKDLYEIHMASGEDNYLGAIDNKYITKENVGLINDVELLKSVPSSSLYRGDYSKEGATLADAVEILRGGGNPDLNTGARVAVPMRQAEVATDVGQEMGRTRLNEIKGERIGVGRPSIGKARAVGAGIREADSAIARRVAAAGLRGAKTAGMAGLGALGSMPADIALRAMGRPDDMTVAEDYRQDEALAADVLGFAQRSEMPVYSLSPERKAAAMMAIRSGRSGLRPPPVDGVMQDAITDEEIQFLLRDMADPGNPTVSRPRYEAPKAAPRSNELK